MSRWKIYDVETGETEVCEMPEGVDAGMVAEAYVADAHDGDDAVDRVIYVAHPDGTVWRCEVTLIITIQARSTERIVTAVPDHVSAAMEGLR